MNATLGVDASRAFMRGAQNGDGGWGYHAGAQSRVEPTCWSLCALAGAQDAPSHSNVLSKARKFLLTSQEEDGFWAAAPEMETGNWVTSLACIALAREAEAREATKAALAWLCKDYPFDSSPWLRLIRRLRPQAHIAQQNDAYRGWGWTPRTSSWVEPTAFALLAMQEVGAQQLPAAAARRRELAVAMLYDRVCPGGGWNCGNPRVYGVPGEALVSPTAWALLALRPFPEHEGKSASLAWLAAAIPRIESPGSLALASLCFEAYGRESPPAKIDLNDYSPERLAEDGIHVLAWVCLALNSRRAWPARNGGSL